jgi:hypothetical protein
MNGPAEQFPVNRQNEAQISAPSGQQLYAPNVNTSGKYLNQVSRQYEAYDANNWGSYIIPFVEPVANSGMYFANLYRAGIPNGLSLLPIYQQAGEAAAPTDARLSRDGKDLTLVVDWTGTAANSIAPLGSSPDNQAAQLPAPQNSLQFAQTMLNKWTTAEATLATTGLASVTVDGEQSVYRNAMDVATQVQYWKNQVALLSGARRRVSTLRMGW